MSDFAPAPPRSEISPSAFGFLERGLPPASGCVEWGYRRLAMTLLCISATFTAVLPIPICVDIIARMFFGMALDGIMEIETMALVVIVFFAMAYVTVSDGHIRIDLLTTLMPQRTQNRLIFFAHVMCAGISAAIAWQAGKTAWDWNELTPILNLPEWLFVMSTSVGLGMVSLGFCFQVRRSALTLIHDRDYFGLILALAVLGLLCSAPWLYKMSGVKVSGLVLGAIGFLILFTMLMLRVPIGFAMALIGLLGLLALKRTPVAAFSSLGDIPFRHTADFIFVAVPMFMLMGELTFYSGLSKDLFDCANKWLGRLPGGLAVATVGGCAGFGAVCGESLPTVITMSSVALPQMRESKYDPGLATGALAAGGTLGILIPPSMGFIFYSIMTEESVGKLFVAGILPGILLTCLFMLVIVIEVKRNPSLAPRSAEFPLREKLKSLVLLIPMAGIFTLVVGGILVGAFTPGEGGAVGAMGAFLYALGRRRLRFEDLKKALFSTTILAGKIFVIFVGVYTFGAFLASSRLPFLLSDFIVGLDLNRYAVLAIIVGIYIVLGCVMNIVPMMLLTLPSIYPSVMALGFDGIWFGVITVIVMEMGLITPPIGLNVFTLSSLAPDIPLAVIFRGVLPFFLAMCVCVLLVVLFPPLALWLPGLMM